MAQQEQAVNSINARTRSTVHATPRGGPHLQRYNRDVVAFCWGSCRFDLIYSKQILLSQVGTIYANFSPGLKFQCQRYKKDHHTLFEPIQIHMHTYSVIDSNSIHLFI